MSYDKLRSERFISDPIHLIHASRPKEGEDIEHVPVIFAGFVLSEDDTGNAVINSQQVFVTDKQHAWETRQCDVDELRIPAVGIPPVYMNGDKERIHHGYNHLAKPSPAVLDYWDVKYTRLIQERIEEHKKECQHMSHRPTVEGTPGGAGSEHGGAEAGNVEAEEQELE